MEAISNSLGSKALAKEVTPRSGKRPLTSGEIATILRMESWMKATYPNQEVTPDITKRLKADWTEVILQYGEDMLKEGLRRHRKVSNYLPSPHDLEVQIGFIREERAQDGEERAQAHLNEQALWKRQYLEEQAAGRQIFFSCEFCEGTGYHMTHRNGTRYIVSPKKGSCPECEGKGLVRDYDRAMKGSAS